jgi:hypothetical protein
MTFMKRVYPAAFVGLVAVAGCMDTSTAAGVNQSSEQAASGKDVISFQSNPISASGEVRFEAYVTGYSYWDNTPPGSAAIAYPVVHRTAGGTGTYQDPITLAVGHRIDGQRRSIDYPVGTRFYLENLRKYAIVEDLCGDGGRPQDGPCHAGYQGRPWLDIYVDGARSARSASNTCMNKLTQFHTVVQNPAPDYPVVAGALTESGCQVF